MKITIITPTFNSVEYLEKSIISVLNQNYEELEYLFIDGGSVDGTLDLIKVYAKDRPFVRWLSEPDDGIADAFNKGLAMATGDWIGILNSDDRYVPETLSKVCEAIRKNPLAEIVHGDLLRLDESGEELFLLKPVEVGKVIWHQMPINHPATFVARKVYEELGDFDVSLKVAMDYELVLRFYLAGKKFFYINKILAQMSYGGASDERFIDVRREVYRVTVQRGYPRYKALFWLGDNVLRGFCKGILRRLGLHGLLRLHPRFHKGDA